MLGESRVVMEIQQTDRAREDGTANAAKSQSSPPLATRSEPPLNGIASPIFWPPLTDARHTNWSRTFPFSASVLAIISDIGLSKIEPGSELFEADFEPAKRCDVGRSFFERAPHGLELILRRKTSLVGEGRSLRVPGLINLSQWLNFHRAGFDLLD